MKELMDARRKERKERKMMNANSKKEKKEKEKKAKKETDANIKVKQKITNNVKPTVESLAAELEATRRTCSQYKAAYYNAIYDLYEEKRRNRANVNTDASPPLTQITII